MRQRAHHREDDAGDDDDDGVSMLLPEENCVAAGCSLSALLYACSVVVRCSSDTYIYILVIHVRMCIFSMYVCGVEWSGVCVYGSM